MKILIVKTSALGDIVHSYLCIAYLKQKFPASLIDWVVESSNSALVFAHPDINRTLVIDSRKWRKKSFCRQTRKEVKSFYKKLREVNYDVVFDLQGNSKSAVVTFMSKAHMKVGFGFKNVAEWPNLLVTSCKIALPMGMNIRHDYLYLVQSYFADFSDNFEKALVLQSKEPSLALEKERDQLLIMVCPGSQWKNKQLRLETFQSFLTLLQQELNCFFYFIWGSEEEKAYVSALEKTLPHARVLERLSLPTLQNVMHKMHLVISVDSLPLHLAGTTGVPTFSIFGPSLATKYMPLEKSHGFFQGRCPYHQTFEKRCPKLRTCPTGNCLRALCGRELFQAFLDWYKDSFLPEKKSLL